MNESDWYEMLILPEWAPPAWLFGPVWSFLYVIIALSFLFVFYKIARNRIPLWIGVPFLLNLFFNALFTPIQFGLQNNFLASVDIILVLLTLIWAMWAIHKYYPWVAYVNIPYVLWVSFATVLQLTITYLNW